MHRHVLYIILRMKYEYYKSNNIILTYYNVRISGVIF